MTSVHVCVVIPALSAAQQDRIRSALTGHSLRFVGGAAPEVMRAAVAEAEVVVGNVAPAWLEAAPRLRWVQLESAGVDAYLRLPVRREGPPLQLTHLASFFDAAVAEAALAGLLAVVRQLPALIVAQRESRWIKPEVEPGIGSIAGRRALVLGAGGIGRRVGELLRAFGADVTWYARTSRPGVLAGTGALEAELPRTDLLVGALPHTVDTERLLDADRLGRLRPGAIVVNVGRGSTLDEAALRAQLDAGRIAWAVLDVTAVEPLPAADPLWRHPRVLLTQHTGGRFPGESDRKVEVFLDNWTRFLAGEPLRHPVHVGRGY